MREAWTAHFRFLPKTRSGRGQREHCTIFPPHCAGKCQVGHVARLYAPESVPGETITPNRHDPETQDASHYRQNRCVYLCNGAFTFAYYVQLSEFEFRVGVRERNSEQFHSPTPTVFSNYIQILLILSKNLPRHPTQTSLVYSFRGLHSSLQCVAQPALGPMVEDWRAVAEDAPSPLLTLDDNAD